MSSENDAVGVLIGHPATAWLFRGGQRLRRWDARHRWALDTLVILAVFVMFCLPDLTHDKPHLDKHAAFTERPLPQLLLFQAGLLIPLWWRRRAPLLAFHAVAGVFLVQVSMGIVMRADLALLVAVYSLVLHGRLGRLHWAAPVLIVAFVLLVARLSAVASVWDVLFVAVSAGTAAAALGFAMRLRRAQLAALRERAVQLEIERDQRSRLAAATERTRIAREMHDIIGHSLAVIITLADGGAAASDTAPERSKQALQLIGDTGRRSLAELRRMLGVLREQATGQPGEQATGPSLRPQPGIAELTALCHRIRDAGPHVEYQTTGNLETLDLGIQLTTYRMVQEALTNALKHAGPHTRVHLALRVDGPRLRILVRDSGPPGAADRPAPAQQSHGLIGMRERAALYGGTVTAGPTPDGGWSVDITLDLAPLPGPGGDTP